MKTSCDHLRRSAELVHAASCPDCQDAVRALHRVERALATVHDDRRPPPGWQTRVLAATAEPPRRVAPWSWFRIVAPLGVAAAVVIAAVALRPPPAPATVALDVSVRVHPGMRGSGDGPGLLTARGAGGPAGRVLWIYRSNTLVHRCPGDAGCAASGGVITARFDADAAGSYTILYVAGAQRVESTRSLETDLSAAVAAGSEIVIKTVEVR